MFLGREYFARSFLGFLCCVYTKGLGFRSQRPTLLTKALKSGVQGWGAGASWASDSVFNVLTRILHLALFICGFMASLAGVLPDKKSAEAN